MSLMKLWSDGGQDVTCPHCSAQFGAEWDTEYGDPIPGTGDLCTCPKCKKDFLVDVEVVTTYTVRKS